MNKRGFTIIELLISLGIVSIVFSIIFSFFTMNFNMFKKSNDIIDIQNEGQIAMAKIVNIAMVSSGISNIYDYNNINQDDTKDKISLGKIIFKEGDIFQVKEGNLKHNGNIIANHIKNIKVSPIDDISFLQSNGLIIEIILELNKETIKIENQVMYRNK
ncbi:PilW family protein [Alkalithermobacter paradoxus]|uniref:Prepilin-type N-terminal cleavage/methylation domain-containing protein n=1 Tax=Alkalithermobacter paradoxus TaxID=29349 RepID=A0A1V4I8T4_9FIRM|nr:hypothetical protein CLOTH_07430 [[Clostridium] thermoalcaliphilum]